MKKLLLALAVLVCTAVCTDAVADTLGGIVTKAVYRVTTRQTTVPAMAVAWESGTSRIERHGLVKVIGGGQGWIPLRMTSGDRLESVDVYVANESSGDVIIGVTRRDVSSPSREMPIVTSVQRSTSGFPYRRVTLSVGHTVKSGDVLAIEILCDTGCTIGGAVYRHQPNI